MVTGIIVLAHGSRGERGKGEVDAALKRIAANLRPLLGSDCDIIGAALQFNHPNLEEAVALLSEKGLNRIIIAPYFLFSGRHVTEHIPQLTAKLRSEYPKTQFILADTLGSDNSFIRLMAKRIKQAVPDLAEYAHGSLPTPIEQESMKILEGLLPPLPNLSTEEITVVKRIIHACGDTGVANLIRFSPSSVSDGLFAIGKGSPIITDVRMVMTGIDSRLAEVFGCPISCALDETGTAILTDDRNSTRTASAIRHLGVGLRDAIVAIGNAPTALLALLDLIDQGIKPSLVLGMPVGFVQAKDSKDELMKRDISYISVIGTRGGSAMAAATVNALFKIAADKYQCHSPNKKREGITKC